MVPLPAISRPRFLLLVGVGVSLRLLLIWTSIGTNDVVNWIAFAGLVDKVGIAESYSRIAELNHPPLSLAILLGLEKLRLVSGIEIGDLLRIVQVLFDVVAVAALWSIGRVTRRSPERLALFYFLSPVSMMVTGFHGNTDPAMVALLLASLALLLRDEPWPFTAGLLFAAAVGIKIVPLLLLPLLVLWRRDRWRLLAGVASALAASFLPFVLLGGFVVIERIFGYNTQEANSGLPYLLFSLAELLRERAGAAARLLANAAVAWVAVARYAVLFAVAAYSLALTARNRRDDARLLAGCGTILLFILVLSPGGGLQYLVWPIAFLPFALAAAERWLVVAVFSLTQFTLYTIWSDGFPWWFADSTAVRPGIDLVWMANLVWLTSLAAGSIAVVRTLRAPQPTTS